MQQGNQPGDGRTSPFGGTPGGRGLGGNVAGAGNNFVTNPGGSAPKAKIPDLINTSRQQPMAKPDVNPQDAAAGGLIPQAAPPATRPGGVGTVGNGAKPFKLGG